MEGFDYIKSNYLSLLDEIRQLSISAGREVALVAVTKSGSDEELIALASAGVSHIGENRPGELRRRGDLLRERGYMPCLHEIGNLQRNKVKLIIESVDLIHSLDSLALAAEIDKQAKRVGRRVRVLIEVNSAREEQKGGIMPEDTEAFYKSLKEFSSIDVAGLMTMGPVCDDPEEIRPYFQLTKELFDSMNKKGCFTDGILSMGMSDSYRVAIEEGSTLVRVGRKLFVK
ncbi:MAG: YggS family pyridoxal phosphate-dependent enzyme [Clostridia bacterium]|nr:YggS family pyridoxal phosphate-dependent enzyme [Clostridia bacterium]